MVVSSALKIATVNGIKNSGKAITGYFSSIFALCNVTAIVALIYGTNSSFGDVQDYYCATNY